MPRGVWISTFPITVRTDGAHSPVLDAVAARQSSSPWACAYSPSNPMMSTPMPAEPPMIVRMLGAVLYADEGGQVGARGKRRDGKHGEREDGSREDRIRSVSSFPGAGETSSPMI